MTIYSDSEDDIGFVYVWQNLITGKSYCGSHRGEPNDRYVTSGIAIKKAIKKYGIENFRRRVIYYGSAFRDAETLVILTLGLCESKQWYNLSHTHKGGCDHSPEVRERLSHIALNMSSETRDKMSKARQGKEPWNKGLQGYMKGRIHSEETRKKMSDSLAGKKRAPASEEARLARSIAATGKKRGPYKLVKTTQCPHCGKVGTPGGMAVHHFERCSKFPYK